MAELDENGHEILDDTPVSMPVRFNRMEGLTDQIRRIIREEASRAAEMAGFETFEEADDFEIEDDYDPRSPHELTLEQELEGYGDRDKGRSNSGTSTGGEGTPEGAGELQQDGENPASTTKTESGGAGSDS